MELVAFKILIGFVVGTLIGMTGLGGGVLLLPLLIFGLKVPAILAVGSDAVFNFITKIGSSWVHLRKGTVRRKVVLALAVFAGLNFLSFDYFRRWDLTRQHEFTLPENVAGEVKCTNLAPAIRKQFIASHCASLDLVDVFGWLPLAIDLIALLVSNFVQADNGV